MTEPNEDKRPVERVLEGALITTFGWQMLTDQSGLSTIPGEVADHLHIYLICQRGRISAITEEWHFTKETVSAVFAIQHQDSQERIEVEGPNQFGDSEVEVRCEYPYTWVELRDSSGEFAGGHAGMLLPLLAGYRLELDLEVLYVGQAYGKDGTRSAGERLGSHETLQSIYAEAIRKAPDKEIWLVLLGPTPPYSMIQLGPRPPVPMSNPSEEELAADLTRLMTPVSDQQVINIAEASLIRYFSPPYNKVYKERFPNPAHKTYADCYELDLNTVGFELETEPIGSRLWSEAREASWIHSATFPLHDEDDRRRMFDFASE